jgi:hypothetical protein
MMGASSCVRNPIDTDLHAVFLCGNDLLAVGRQLRVDAEHQRDIRTVDVAVEEPDAAPALRQRQCQVHSDRGLADAALSGADGDDVLDARQRRPARFPAPTLTAPSRSSVRPPD